MPQDVYALHIGDSTTILVDIRHIGGFDTLDNDTKQKLAQQVLNKILQKNAEQPVTFSDFAIPITLLVIFSLLILWLAKKIAKHPKLYDTIVKMDGKPNPEYGKGWRREK